MSSPKKIATIAVLGPRWNADNADMTASLDHFKLAVSVAMPADVSRPTYDPKQRKAEWRANQRRHKA